MMYYSEEDKIAFTFKSNSLPWIVLQEAQMAYKITNAGFKMSLETFRVVGIEPGNYNLKIDGNIVGKYNFLDLACGIELQENNKTVLSMKSITKILN